MQKLVLTLLALLRSSTTLLLRTRILTLNILLLRSPLPRRLLRRNWLSIFARLRSSHSLLLASGSSLLGRRSRRRAVRGGRREFGLDLGPGIAGGAWVRHACEAGEFLVVDLGCGLGGGMWECEGKGGDEPREDRS
jgi:hypothetical protein